jgi:hypothetical protein
MNKKIITWIIASLFLINIAFAFEIQGNGYFIRGSMNDQPVGVIQGGGYVIDITPTKEGIIGSGYNVTITPPIAVSVLGGAPADYEGINIAACSPTSTTCDNYIDLSAFNADFSQQACVYAGYEWSSAANQCCGDDSLGDIGLISTTETGEPAVR